MSRSDGLPPEMFRRSSTRAADPLALDEPTAARLLAGAIEPADAPPGYAPVAAVLVAAAAPGRPEELAGGPPTLAGSDRSHPPGRPRARSLRLVALVGVALVALGGAAAAATGSLPRGAQSIAHDAFGMVGVSVPAPGPAQRRPHRAVPTRRSTRRAAHPVPPQYPVEPRHPSPRPPVAARPHRAVTVPAPTRSPHPRPAPSGIAAVLCRAAAAGHLGPGATGRAGLAYRSLAGLAHGAANIAAYCRGVLG